MLIDNHCLQFITVWVTIDGIHEAYFCYDSIRFCIYCKQSIHTLSRLHPIGFDLI
jgi:hypothetical protein